MKTSEIFAACIPLIESGEYDFICHALCEVIKGSTEQNVWDTFQEEGYMAHGIVMDRLAGEDHLLGFVYEIRDVFRDIFDPERLLPSWSPSDAELQEFRILWLESLVAEFQQLGD